MMSNKSFLTRKLLTQIVVDNNKQMYSKYNT
jgi:hypothetical protein